MGRPVTKNDCEYAAFYLRDAAEEGWGGHSLVWLLMHVTEEHSLYTALHRLADLIDWKEQ